MQWSRFGEAFGQSAGIVQLMDDLGEALAENPDMLFLGGGNPAHIPAAQAVFTRRLQNVLDSSDAQARLFGVYQAPQGDRAFRKDVAALLKQEYGWPVSERNIALANGSQSAFFILFNMLAGIVQDAAGQDVKRTVHLPVVPEYIGYGDAGINSGMFSSRQPAIEYIDDDLFKYRADFTGDPIPDEAAAICVSRPTNPTGNVLTDSEMARLDSLAQQRDIPLIVDGAYGLPFPALTYIDAVPHWNENTVLMLSLSKLGLPGARTGIIIAREEITHAFANANTIMSLSCGNLGPAIVHELFRNGEVLSLSRNKVRPYYQDKSQYALATFRKELAGIPYRLHVPEGGMFLWLWLPRLTVSTQELYQRLKQRGVLVVPGEHFFIACDEAWEHQHQCLRISFAQGEDVVRQGAAIIADEVRARSQL
ncbi:MAG: valine--pyruvate transaminase [Gammaproteobacteria bacterium]|nr:MAG: valine--pyruvate transaminase [Gammaproteobacteria bacterium]